MKFMFFVLFISAGFHPIVVDVVFYCNNLFKLKYTPFVEATSRKILLGKDLRRIFFRHTIKSEVHFPLPRTRPMMPSAKIRSMLLAVIVGLVAAGFGQAVIKDPPGKPCLHTIKIAAPGVLRLPDRAVILVSDNDPGFEPTPADSPENVAKVQFGFGSGELKLEETGQSPRLQVYRNISSWRDGCEALGRHPDAGVGTLVLTGHGSSRGGISTKTPGKWLDSDCLTDDEARILQNKLKPEAIVILLGCHCATSGEFIRLSQKFHRRVIGNTGTVYGDCGEGDWVITQPFCGDVLSTQFAWCKTARLALDGGKEESFVGHLNCASNFLVPGEARNAIINDLRRCRERVNSGQVSADNLCIALAALKQMRLESSGQSGSFESHRESARRHVPARSLGQFVFAELDEAEQYLGIRALKLDRLDRAIQAQKRALADLQASATESTPQAELALDLLKCRQMQQELESLESDRQRINEQADPVD
jgi:hypothetical protein